MIWSKLSPSGYLINRYSPSNTAKCKGIGSLVAEPEYCGEYSRIGIWMIFSFILF